MMKYRFFNKNVCTCTKQEAIEFIRTTEKPFKYTYGLRYRKPSTMDEPITREQALKHMEDTLVDMDEHETYVHINRYSNNDLW